MRKTPAPRGRVLWSWVTLHIPWILRAKHWESAPFSIFNTLFNILLLYLWLSCWLAATHPCSSFLFLGKFWPYVVGPLGNVNRFLLKMLFFPISPDFPLSFWPQVLLFSLFLFLCLYPGQRCELASWLPNFLTTSLNWLFSQALG